jgi:hypothetical protein
MKTKPMVAPWKQRARLALGSGEVKILVHSSLVWDRDQVPKNRDHDEARMIESLRTAVLPEEVDAHITRLTVDRESVPVLGNMGGRFVSVIVEFSRGAAPVLLRRLADAIESDDQRRLEDALRGPG